MRMDIGEMVVQARAFQARLDAAKARIPSAGFEWYPYDSFGNLARFDGILKQERRFLLDLAGDDPVLDVGCADGALSFFLESLGRRVVAVDYAPANHNDMRGIRALHQELGSAVEIHEIDLDGPFRLPHACYGLVLLLGVLYHLKNPIYVLETLARQARYCLLSTRVVRMTPDKQIRFDRAPMAYLLEEREANDDPSNYWIFSEAGLRRLLRRTAWEICDWMTTPDLLDSDPVSPQGDERAFCLLQSRQGGPESNAQLLEGWHELEGGSWRWTERRFVVALKTPAPGRPATLRLKFLLPPELLARLHSVTLSATVNGVPLAPQTYTGAGDQIYARSVPAAALAAESVRVEFQLDRALAPDEADHRERGLVVSYVWLEETS
ncbi:MAG: class I SAM-dependent methyltransferase [Acidobacteria bacterium]|nr:class I SAM-dependent methyltransferase [Acidobacteriota bacterium]